MARKSKHQDVVGHIYRIRYPRGYECETAYQTRGSAQGAAGNDSTIVEYQLVERQSWSVAKLRGLSGMVKFAGKPNVTKTGGV
jgi:hypothetical protein